MSEQVKLPELIIRTTQHGDSTYIHGNKLNLIYLSNIFNLNTLKIVNDDIDTT